MPIPLGYRGHLLNWNPLRRLSTRSSAGEGPRLVSDIRINVSAEYLHVLRTAESSIIKAFAAIQNRKDLETRFYASQQRQNQEPTDFVYDLLNCIKTKFEERYSCKAIRGSRNGDNVERRGWNEHRMSNVNDNRRNWRNSEVVRRPSNGRIDYGG
ncbi:uncharacterized protein TNCV_1481341 [Trichonephila clavipes]|nr:uncharacterized protein TNCV_1481341 [Trichonephila clavipes]